MKRDLKEVIKSIIWYNGLYEFLQLLKEEIIKCDDNSYHVTFKEWYEKLLKESDQVQFLWMILVLLFGDYGTSPRWGWLEMEHKNEIIEFIDELIPEEDLDIIEIDE